MQRLLLLVFPCVCLCPLPVQAADDLPPPAKRKIDFIRDVQPLFVRHCASCHGADEQKSGFRLDQRDAAFAGGAFGEPPIVKGNSGDSPLVRYVAGLDGLRMPPKGPRLTAEEVGLIRAWIDQGAAWPDEVAAGPKLTTDHWSYQPLTSPTVPEILDADLPSPIDAFVLQRLRDAGLTFSPPADRTTLIRRLYLDLHGIPPTPAEIKQFLADDRPDAYRRLVDRALASPRYGERWARHWLDVVRFAETSGFETNVERPHAWRYRDYVIDALNRDLPYDRFVFEQIAGDAVGAGAATGFLVGGAHDRVRSPDPVLTAMQRSDELADITNTTATAFLGVTIGCARCHNHKFDPVLQKDYYALEAVFAGVRHGDRRIQPSRSPADEQRLAAGEIRLAEIERALAELQPLAGAPRIWIDDEQLTASDSEEPGVELLQPKAGHGVNPAGSARGQRDDPGDAERLPNLSGGRYTWWQNPQPGKDYLRYRPRARGRYRVWISWGSGWETHATDAAYLLDRDGDPTTRDDQTAILTANQQLFAGGQGQTVSQPLWSGFADAGVHDFSPEAAIILRAGETGTALTADAIVLETVAEEAAAGSQPTIRPAVNSRRNIERFAPIEARFLRFTITATNNNTEPCLDELEVFSSPSEGQPPRNVARDAKVQVRSSGNYAGDPKHRLEHLNDGQFGNGRSWISNTRGAGWVELEFPEPTLIDRIAWGRDREEQYQDRTPVDYRIEVAVEPGKWRVAATSRDRAPHSLGAQAVALTSTGLTPADAARAEQWRRQRAAIEKRLAPLREQPLAYAGVFTTPPTTRRLFRGDPMQPREEVAPDSLTVLGSLDLGLDAGERERRVALARWIASEQNPLTPRVIANRVWQHHFGTGLVDTPSDLGANGGQPSHPELLDWLARRLIDGGWSLKRLHREILLSRTYRQSSRPHPRGLAADAAGRLLWRYPSRRLEAEPIRDSILAVSGNLDLAAGGPGWSAFEPNSNYVRVYEPKQEFGPAEWRRAIYMTKVRMEQDGVFGVFDCPDAGQVAPKRPRSTTALQALSLFNSPFTLAQAERFAARVTVEAGADPDAQVERAYLLGLGRSPADEERTAAATFVRDHGLPALCRALLNSSEFLFVP